MAACQTAADPSRLVYTTNNYFQYSGKTKQNKNTCV